MSLVLQASYLPRVFSSIHPTHNAPGTPANEHGRRAECRRWDDKSVSPVIRQSLLHWAYELTEADFKKISKEIKL